MIHCHYRCWTTKVNDKLTTNRYWRRIPTKTEIPTTSPGALISYLIIGTLYSLRGYSLIVSSTSCKYIFQLIYMIVPLCSWTWNSIKMQYAIHTVQQIKKKQWKTNLRYSLMYSMKTIILLLLGPCLILE